MAGNTMALPAPNGRQMIRGDATMPDPEQVAFSPEEVATMLGVKVRAVYAEVKAGNLRAVRVGRLLRIPKGSVDAFLRGERPGKAPNQKE